MNDAQDRTTDPRFRTANGKLITDGLRVWDYDRRTGAVDFEASGIDSEYWDGWFQVALDVGGHSYMNGERLATWTPVDGAVPPAPVPLPPDPVTVTVNVRVTTTVDRAEWAEHWDCDPAEVETDVAEYVQEHMIPTSHKLHDDMGTATWSVVQ
jgi:hypothetical protein